MIERCENFERYPVKTLEGWCHATDEPICCGGERPFCRHLGSFFPLAEIDFVLTDEDFARMEHEEQKYRSQLRTL